MKLPQAGDVLEGRYDLEELLGQGASAWVFRAFDATTERRVALKVFKPDAAQGAYRPNTMRRFDREAHVIAGLRDPHTVTLYASGTTADGLLYMVFEFVHGTNLAAVLAERGRLRPRDAVHILRQVLASLREAHAEGLLHRDLKPENIVVFATRDDDLAVKVLDFGLAKGVDPGATVTRKGELVGTPRYMSPEALLEERLSPASDVYAAGILAMELLLGREAIHGNAWHEQYDRLVTGHVFSIPTQEHIPPELRDVLRRMCAQKPEDRYSDAGAALAALENLVIVREDATTQHELTLPEGVPPDDRLGRTRTFQPARKPLDWRVAAGAAAIATVIGGVFAWVTTAPPPVVHEPPQITPALARAPVAVDAGTPEEDLAVAAPPQVDDRGGCGREPPFTGTKTVRDAVGFERWSWEARIPRGYSPDREYAVVMLFHNDGATGRELLTQTRIAPIADREGVIVIAPNGRAPLAWRDPADFEVAQAALERTKHDFCVDRGRVFLVGHATGGRVVEALSCEPWVTAVATSSYLTRGRDFGCDLPIPAIHLAPLHSKHVPIEGGPGCAGLSTAYPLATWERRWRERNRCRDHSTTRDVPDGHCETWDCRGAPFVSCKIDGGLGWPGSNPRSVADDILQCDGTPSAKFPATNLIWKLFRESPPL